MGKGLLSFNSLARVALCFILAGMVMTLGPTTRVVAHDETRIEIRNGIHPGSVDILPGTTVEWRNKDDRSHTVTSTTGVFDSGIIPKGGRYSHTFTSPGTYAYTDRFSSLTGTIRVPGSSPAPDQDQPPPSGLPPPSSTASSAALRIGDNFFSPASITVSAGATVTWTNSGGKPHTVTNNSGVFNSGTVNPGQSFSFTFQNPGTYSYYCAFHDGQSGIVQVTGTSASPGQSTSSSSASTSTTASTSNQNQTTSSTTVPGSLTVGDNFFSPVSFTVASGATVTWVNSGQRPHTVTSNSGVFDSGMMNPGQSYSFTFQNPGTYSYYCAFHDGQSGIVQVTGTSGSTAQTTSSDQAPIQTTTSAFDPSSTATTSSGNAPPSPSLAATMLTASSSIGDNFFSPDSLSVPVGATVTWTNSGRFPHTVTSDAKLFDSGMLKPGQSFSFTFQALGEYRYYCLYHPGQTGMVLVSEEGVSQIPQSHTLSHDKHADKMENIVQGSQPLEMLADTKDSGQLSAIAPVATAATGKTNRLSDFVPQAWAATSILALAAGTVAAFLRARKSGQF